MMKALEMMFSAIMLVVYTAYEKITEIHNTEKYCSATPLLSIIILFYTIFLLKIKNYFFLLVFFSYLF